jgi:hypothetical protein
MKPDSSLLLGPAAIVEQLNTEIIAALADPSL